MKVLMSDTPVRVSLIPVVKSLTFSLWKVGQHNIGEAGEGRRTNTASTYQSLQVGVEVLLLVLKLEELVFFALPAQRINT